MNLDPMIFLVVVLAIEALILIAILALLVEYDEKKFKKLLHGIKPITRDNLVGNISVPQVDDFPTITETNNENTTIYGYPSKDSIRVFIDDFGRSIHDARLFIKVDYFSRIENEFREVSEEEANKALRILERNNGMMTKGKEEWQEAYVIVSQWKKSLLQSDENIRNKKYYDTRMLKLNELENLVNEYQRNMK